MKILNLKTALIGMIAVLTFAMISSCKKNSPGETKEPEIPTNPSTVVPFKDFVYTKETKVYLNGKQWTPHGGSLYPTGPSSNFKDSGFKGYMENIMISAKDDKFTTVRVVNFIDGSTSDPYDATVWGNVDYLIAQAASQNLKVILDLSTFRNHILKGKKMPYDYTLWKDMIDFVGKRYKDNTTVWLYSLAGEAEGPRAGDPANTAYRPSTEQLTTFYREASDALHAVAPKQLISCGGLIFLDYNSGVDWKSIFALPNIHVPAIHVYGTAMKAILPVISEWCIKNKKPLLLEEFGMEKTASDAVISAYFQEIYNITKSNKLIGACFWNYGPQATQNSFDINEQTTPLTLKVVRNNSPLK